jgi:hypothetical protein
MGRTLEVRLCKSGVGRFTKLGFPFPHLTANFVGGLEIIGWLLLLSGLMTRLIAIPLVVGAIPFQTSRSLVNLRLCLSTVFPNSRRPQTASAV